MSYSYDDSFANEYLYSGTAKSTDAICTLANIEKDTYLTDLMVDGNKIKHIMIRKDSTMYTLEFDEIGRLIIKMENI